MRCLSRGRTPAYRPSFRRTDCGQRPHTKDIPFQTSGQVLPSPIPQGGRAPFSQVPARKRPAPMCARTYPLLSVSAPFAPDIRLQHTKRTPLHKAPPSGSPFSMRQGCPCTQDASRYFLPPALRTVRPPAHNNCPSRSALSRPYSPTPAPSACPFPEAAIHKLSPAVYRFLKESAQSPGLRPVPAQTPGSLKSHYSHHKRTDDNIFRLKLRS